MPRNYSANHHRDVNAVSGGQLPALLLEINHPDLAEPVRVINDNQDLVHQGSTFVAMAFRAAPPEDLSEGSPKATLAVDNIGRDLTDWIEASGGGQGATVRMMQVRRADPDTVEWEVTLDMTNIKVNSQEVTATLGFTDILNQPAIPLTYRPDTAPGLF